MKITRLFALLLASLLCTTTADSAAADMFGSDVNTFSIDFVNIGNPGNIADTTDRPNPNPAGSVAKPYRIGKYEISEQMIVKANAEGGLGITIDARGANMPATSVSWFEAAKFANWLNISTGNMPAYKFDGSGNFQLWASSDPGYNPNNLYRNSQAKYFLPSVDEWYKAAYFDPSGGVYFDYPTGSNSVPDGIDFVGDPIFDLVFYQGGENEDPNDVINVGVLSPYGTAGQGGNVFEWEETAYDLLNDSSSSTRAFRGGSWFYFSDHLSSSNRFIGFPTADVSYFIGFRVASVLIPEPNTTTLVAFACLSLVWCQSRRRN